MDEFSHEIYFEAVLVTLQSSFYHEKGRFIARSGLPEVIDPDQGGQSADRDCWKGAESRGFVQFLLSLGSEP